MNCCCDVDCSSDQRVVFSRCLPLTNTLDTSLCYPHHAIQHNSTYDKSANTESGMLCIVQQNIHLSTDFTDVPVSIIIFYKRCTVNLYKLILLIETVTNIIQ